MHTCKQATYSIACAECLFGYKLNRIDWEGLKVDSLRDKDTDSVAVGKPRVGTASPEGGSAGEKIYTACGSTESTRTYLKRSYTNTV